MQDVAVQGRQRQAGRQERRRENMGGGEGSTDEEGPNKMKPH